MPAYTNARQHFPQAFKDIIANDARREEIRDGFVAGSASLIDWRELSLLVQDRKNLRASAERALRWNTDKGNPGRVA